jgi:hypothetical protein
MVCYNSGIDEYMLYIVTVYFHRFKRFFSRRGTRDGDSAILCQEGERHHSSASDAFMNGSYEPEIIL